MVGAQVGETESARVLAEARVTVLGLDKGLELLRQKPRPNVRPSDGKRSFVFQFCPSCQQVCPSPLYVHNSCMQHQIIRCASAAAKNGAVSGIVEGGLV
jgi:hypothetical protein